MSFILQHSFVSPAADGGDNSCVFALDANTVFVVWHDYDGPFTNSWIKFSKSVDGGATWSVSQIIDTVDPTVSDIESLRISTLDGVNLVVAAIQYSYSPQTGAGSPGALRVSLSTNGGISWSNTQPTVDTDTYYHSGGCDVQLSAGHIFISYNTYSYNNYSLPFIPGQNHNKLAKSDDDGATWTITNTSAPVGTGSDTPWMRLAGSTIFVMYDETDYTAYSGFQPTGSVNRNTTWLVKSTDCGATWSTPVAIFNSSDGSQFSSGYALGTLDGNTLFALVGRGTGGARALTIYTSTDSGATWASTGADISTGSPFNYGTVLGFFQANNLEMLVLRQSNAQTSISQTANAGSTWSTTLFQAANSGGYSSISGADPSNIWIYNWISPTTAGIYKSNSPVTGAFLTPTPFMCPAPPLPGDIKGKQFALNVGAEGEVPESFRPGLLELGNTVWVDVKNGSDATGKRGSPAWKFQTVQAALAVVHSGDVVLLAPGTYPGAVAVPSFVTLQGFGARDKVVLSGNVSWTPTSVSSEAVGFMFLQFGGTFTVDTTGKAPGTEIAACRVDSCRFTGGQISYTGRGTAKDNFQLISSFYNTIPFVANDVSVNIDGGLGQFTTITAGGSVDGVYFQMTDVEVASGQYHGTVTCSLGLVEIDRGGIFAGFVTTGTGQITSWGTAVGDVTVAAGTSIFIYDTQISGALSVAGTAVLHATDVATTIDITGTGVVFLHDCSIGGLVTVGASAFLYAWARAIFALDIVGYAELYNLDLGDVHVENAAFAVFESCQQQGVSTVDVGAFVEARGGSVANLLLSGLWQSTGVEVSALTTQVGGFATLCGGRLGNATVHDTTRLSGGCLVFGTVTCVAGFFDGYAGDTRFATFVSSGGTFLPSGGDRYSPQVADFTPSPQDCGVIYQNNGLDINATLPPWSPGLRWGFHVATANRFTITNLDGTTFIYLGILPGLAGGYVNAIHPGSYLEISAALPGVWQSKVVTGQWTPDNPDV